MSFVYKLVLDMNWYKAIKVGNSLCWHSLSKIDHKYFYNFKWKIGLVKYVLEINPANILECG